MSSLACWLCFVLLVGLVPSTTFVRASPYGASGCDGGKAAVGGAHLTGNAVTGSLAQGGFELILDNKYILVPNVPMPLIAGQSYSLSIKAEDGSFFRGVLIRMEGAAGTDEDEILMSPAPGYQGASVCEDIGVRGITHTGPEDQTGLTSIVEFSVPSVQELSVDVTVVVSNNAGEGSEYYYDPFVFDLVTEVTPNVPMPDTIPPVFTPPMAPTQEPTLKPSMDSTKGAETMAPSAATTVPPTSSPTMSSTTAATTIQPANVTTMSPTSGVTVPPTSTPTTLPSLEVTEAPPELTAAPSEEEEVTESPTSTPGNEEQEAPNDTDAPTGVPVSAAHGTSVIVSTLAMTWMMMKLIIM